MSQVSQMPRERYAALMDGRGDLASMEVEAGWHFCPEWDHLLVLAGNGECSCPKEKR